MSYWWGLWLVGFTGFYGRGVKDWRESEPEDRGSVYWTALLGAPVFVVTALIILVFG